MRKDRGISRSKLVITSSSISSLKRFENDGAKIDFDILWAYLERMNIQMDEYQLEYSNYHNSQKEQLRIRFKNVLSNESDIKEYLENLQDEYSESRDVFYLYLIIQLKSVMTKLSQTSTFFSNVTSEEITTL